MNCPRLYSIYIARFPFVESESEKLRPVIVVSEPHGQFHVVSVVPVSSRQILEPVDVSIGSWQAAGLIRPSVARVHRLTALLQADLVSELGRLENRDTDALKQALRQLLAL